MAVDQRSIATVKSAAPSNGQGQSIELCFTENARTVLGKRYLRKGPDGLPVETVAEMLRRVARTVAAPDSEHGQDAAQTEKTFYDLLAQIRFLPNSPTFTGAGTPLGQLAACFVLPIEDDMGRNADGIFSTLRNAALIQQTGGGNGFSFSRLRPKGARVHTSAGIATGPVGFLKVYDKAFGEIAQGGSRRGANMAVLRVDHPDILEFIRCKSSEGEISNFNISVGITDAFMEAVEQDTDFDLINPQDGTVWSTVRARKVFDEIVKFAHHNGEPGLLFLDAANRTNPVPHLYELEATNPCGEQFLGPYENCCLGSINLARHITDSDKIDWAGLRETIEQTTHFLDNVVSANRYVPAVPQLQEAAHRNRRIGLGFMGLGDVMYRLGVRYGSKEAQELASQIAEFIRFHAMRSSIDLARSRGPFPAISDSVYDPQNLQWQPPVPLQPYERDFGRPALDWDEIVQGIRRYGIRNAAQTTVAPTGTISTVAGCEAYGCEPVFALAYTRHVDDNGQDVELQYVSPLFERALKRANLDADRFETIIRQVRRAGSCQDVPNVPDDIRHTFVIAQDIGPEEHVYMQAAIQAFIDNSLSKTINFSENATEQNVAKAYMLAWKLGCKGLTVYVTGSREKVVLETEATKQAKSKAAATQQTPALIVKPRPRRMTGSTYRVLTPLGKAYVTVNHNGDNEPFEVFLNVGKAGSETAAMSEAIGRLISLCLRQPSTLPGHERLANVVNELRGIGGFRAIGFGPRQVRSLPDGVAQALAEHIDLPVENNGYDKDSAEQLPLFPHADLCPECGHAALLREEGCRRCYACGFSEC